jgi:hypothetical protein
VGLDGVKKVLDFEQGSSESKAVVADLIHRLAKRGLIEREDRRLLVVRDGSAAIAGAVAKGWPAAMPQECLVHRHQNLNTTFLSTNLIENVFRNWRQATDNGKVWKEDGDMVPRWVASGLLWAEAGFRKISHFGDLPLLAAALSSSAASSSLRSSSPAEDDNAGSKESYKPKD